MKSCRSWLSTAKGIRTISVYFREAYSRHSLLMFSLATKQRWKSCVGLWKRWSSAVRRSSNWLATTRLRKVSRRRIIARYSKRCDGRKSNRWFLLSTNSRTSCWQAGRMPKSLKGWYSQCLNGWLVAHRTLSSYQSQQKRVRAEFKANLSARAVFRLPTQADSLTVLGQAGAERLMLHGDMLLQHGTNLPQRLQGYSA